MIEYWKGWMVIHPWSFFFNGYTCGCEYRSVAGISIQPHALSVSVRLCFQRGVGPARPAWSLLEGISVILLEESIGPLGFCGRYKTNSSLRPLSPGSNPFEAEEGVDWDSLPRRLFLSGKRNPTSSFMSSRFRSLSIFVNLFWFI